MRLVGGCASKTSKILSEIHPEGGHIPEEIVVYRVLLEDLSDASRAIKVYAPAMSHEQCQYLRFMSTGSE